MCRHYIQYQIFISVQSPNWIDVELAVGDHNDEVILDDLCLPYPQHGLASLIIVCLSDWLLRLQLSAWL
jgi:hypothetical protein